MVGVRAGNGTLDKTEVLNALQMWDKSVQITLEYVLMTSCNAVFTYARAVQEDPITHALAHTAHTNIHRDIEQMWPMFDTNRDGVIDFEEFSNLVQRQLRQDQTNSMLYND
jgi:Ca2+-binding EF-hand superfamily protein